MDRERFTGVRSRIIRENYGGVKLKRESGLGRKVPLTGDPSLQRACDIQIMPDSAKAGRLFPGLYPTGLPAEVRAAHQKHCAPYKN